MTPESAPGCPADKGEARGEGEVPEVLGDGPPAPSPRPPLTLPVVEKTP